MFDYFNFICLLPQNVLHSSACYSISGLRMKWKSKKFPYMYAFVLIIEKLRTIRHCLHLFMLVNCFFPRNKSKTTWLKLEKQTDKKKVIKLWMKVTNYRGEIPTSRERKGQLSKLKNAASWLCSCVFLIRVCQLYCIPTRRRANLSFWFYCFYWSTTQT